MTMRIAIVSDSHSALNELEKLLVFTRSNTINVLIHAGDFITTGIDSLLTAFSEITFYIARGNCDFDSALLGELGKQSNIEIGDTLSFELEGIRFIVSHIPGAASLAARHHGADVVIHGHTHQARIETLDHALFLNPGSLMEGHGFLLLDVPSLKVERRFRFD
jgi:putative phosphoesterase